MSRYRQKLLQEGSNTHKTKTLCLGVILLHLNYDFVNVTHNFLLGLCLDMKGHNIYCLIPNRFQMLNGTLKISVGAQAIKYFRGNREVKYH